MSGRAKKIAMGVFYIAVAYIILLAVTKYQNIRARNPWDTTAPAVTTPVVPQNLFQQVPANMSWDDKFEAAKLAAVDKRYEDAEKLFNECSTEAEKMDPKDPKVVTALNEHAYYYYLTVGKMPEAEAMFKRLVEARKKAVGETDPAVADDILKIANLCGFNKRIDEAVTYYKQALETVEKAPAHEKYKEVKTRILKDYIGTLRQNARDADADELDKQLKAL